MKYTNLQRMRSYQNALFLSKVSIYKVCACKKGSKNNFRSERESNLTPFTPESSTLTTQPLSQAPTNIFKQIFSLLPL
jgi:hypothetical protein